MKTAIIGVGNMGSIYALSFIKYEVLSENELYLLTRNSTSQRTDIKGRQVTFEELRSVQPEIVFICVKPQDYEAIQADLSKILNASSVVISIMAGISISRLQKELGIANIVRAMPNSPVEIGMGITGYSAAKELDFSTLKIIENLLATTGRTIYFEDEEQLNAVTAVSGSGPAYFFYIIKHMIEAGKQMGFSETVATTLVKQTMLGSFHLFNHSGKSAEELIKTVASKGGTTEAAIATFEHYQMDKAIQEGMKNAEKRALELSK